MTADRSAALFPILPAALTGLARMAAEAEHADDGHLVEFRTMQVRSILNRSISKRLQWLAYSINPYRGCEFGCRYCYARYTHEFLAPASAVQKANTPLTVGLRPDDFRDPEAFERVIFLKQNAAWLLEQDLKRVDPAKEIALGTATDPYQPIERKAGITRSLLEVFARKRGYRLGIVTKSTLIERDTDLLTEIGRHNTLVVHITITTPDAELARKLEPRAPRPDLRFRTVRRLRAAGITAGILCCPLLPGITDSERAIDRMAKRAAEVDASFFAGNPLFLKPCSRPTYLSFVREHFPSLVKDYEKRYGSADFVTTAYSRQLARIVQRACIRHGLRQRSHDALLPRDGELELAFRSPATIDPARIPPVRAAESCQQRLFA
jgi:DNA repair photolyase